MLVTPQQMAAAEEALFATGVEAEPLMEEAGGHMARAIAQFCPRPGTLVAFVGGGHNGGDALVVARHFAEAGWRVLLRLAAAEGRSKPLTDAKLAELGGRGVVIDAEEMSLPSGGPLLAIDGLLGIGARGELRSPYRELAAEINSLRREHGAFVAALDIPSGVDGETGDAYPGGVQADLTITVTYPKTGLLADAATARVGRLAIAPVDAISVPADRGDAGAALITPRALRGVLPTRGFETHKGEAGRVGIVAGSTGMTGAAALCAAGALRGGAGLVTLFSNEEAGMPLAPRAPAEAMVRPIRSLEEIAGFNLDALAVGPGLGTADDPLLPALLLENPLPMVIDADALNRIARDLDPADLGGAAGPRLLTPHPGEIARLEAACGLPSDGVPRRRRAEALAEHTGVSVLLKGARSVIATPGRPTAFNSSGHPGMATGGVGDTLTGLCAALAAGGIDVHDAACVASWINGRAAELAALLEGQSAESLIAGDLPLQYGRAFADLRRGAF